jgi:hypothetical protein
MAALTPWPDPPPNDVCPDVIVVTEGVTIYTMEGAAADQEHACYGSFLPDVFYHYVADASAKVTISTCGVLDLNGFEVYLGCDCPLPVNPFIAFDDCNTPETGFWPAAPITDTDCAAVRGLETTFPDSHCSSPGDELTNVAFRLGAAGGQCPRDCGLKDGVIDILDLLTLLAQWGHSGVCDADGSDLVDDTDLVQLLSAWGPCPIAGTP